MLLNRPPHLIELVHHNGTFQPHWLVLHPSGERGATPTKSLATTMSLPEAWCVLQEIRRAVVSTEFEYKIVRA